MKDDPDGMASFTYVQDDKHFDRSRPSNNHRTLVIRHQHITLLVVKSKFRAVRQVPRVENPFYELVGLPGPDTGTQS